MVLLSYMEAPKQKTEYQPSEEDRKAIEESIRIEREETKTRKREASDKELIEDGATYEINDEGEKILKLTEAQIREMNKEKRVEEPEKVSKPKEKISEKIFDNKQNQDVFKQLGTSTKEVISSIYKNVKIGFIDRYRASDSNKLYNRHKEKVGKLENDIIMKKRAIEQIEADIETHEIRTQKLSDKFGGLNEKAEEEILKEKKKLEKKLENANYEETELIAKQVFNEKKLKKYEEKRKEIIAGVESFVSEKTDPYKERINELKENTAELDKDIEDFTSKRDNFGNQLNELKEEFKNLKESKAGIYESESTMYLEKIKEVDTEYNRMNNIVKSVEKEKQGINRKIGKFENKISYWNRVVETAKSDNAPRQEKQPDLETEPTESTKENPEDNKDWYEAVMPSKEKINEYDKTKDWYKASGLSKEDMENVANTESTGEDKEESEVKNYDNTSESVKEDLGNREIYPNEYMNKWNNLFGNKLFGGGLKLDDEQILNILEMPNGINELPLKRMEEVIVEYNNSKGFFSRVSDDELKKMFKLIRDAESINK